MGLLRRRDLLQLEGLRLPGLLRLLQGLQLRLGLWLHLGLLLLLLLQRLLQALLLLLLLLGLLHALASVYKHQQPAALPQQLLPLRVWQQRTTARKPQQPVDLRQTVAWLGQPHRALNQQHHGVAIKQLQPRVGPKGHRRRLQISGERVAPLSRSLPLAQPRLLGLPRMLALCMLCMFRFVCRRRAQPFVPFSLLLRSLLSPQPADQPCNPALVLELRLRALRLKPQRCQLATQQLYHLAGIVLKDLRHKGTHARA